MYLGAVSGDRRRMTLFAWVVVVLGVQGTNASPVRERLSLDRYLFTSRTQPLKVRGGGLGEKLFGRRIRKSKDDSDSEFSLLFTEFQEEIHTLKSSYQTELLDIMLKLRIELRDHAIRGKYKGGNQGLMLSSNVEDSEFASLGPGEAETESIKSNEEVNDALFSIRKPSVRGGSSKDRKLDEPAYLKLEDDSDDMQFSTYMDSFGTEIHEYSTDYQAEIRETFLKLRTEMEMRAKGVEYDQKLYEITIDVPALATDDIDQDSFDDDEGIVLVEPSPKLEKQPGSESLTEVTMDRMKMSGIFLMRRKGIYIASAAARVFASLKKIVYVRELLQTPYGATSLTLLALYLGLMGASLLSKPLTKHDFSHLLEHRTRSPANVENHIKNVPNEEVVSSFVSMFRSNRLAVSLPIARLTFLSVLFVSLYILAKHLVLYKGYGYL